MGRPSRRACSSTAARLLAIVSATLLPPWGLISSSRLVAFMWIGFFSKRSVISSPWMSRNRPGRSNRVRYSPSGLSRTCSSPSTVRVSTQASPNRSR